MEKYRSPWATEGESIFILLSVDYNISPLKINFQILKLKPQLAKGKYVSPMTKTSEIVERKLVDILIRNWFLKIFRKPMWFNHTNNRRNTDKTYLFYHVSLLFLCHLS